MTARSTPCNCAVCGISSDIKPVYFSSKYNMLLCGKHSWQLNKFGKIINASPYNRFDKNPYRIEDGVVYMDINDAYQNKIAETMFDEKFLDDVTQRKWRMCYKKKHQYPYVTAKAYPEENVKHIHLHQYIARLGGFDTVGVEIDHINGNTLDNRLCNLRPASRHEQVSNIAPKHNNKYGIRGVSFDKRYKKYIVDFSLDGMRLYFKPVKTLQEAVYIRHLAEKHFFDDIAIARHLPAMQPYIDLLTEQQKHDLEVYVNGIIQKKERDAS